MVQSSFTLRNSYGQRKYLNRKERKAFLQASQGFELDKKLFFQMLFWTGGRISEVLNVTIEKVDLLEELVVLDTLKKRTQGHTREIPLPKPYPRELTSYIQNIRKRPGNKQGRLWTWNRRSASRYIQAVMNQAGIQGPQASSKGLRHSFAVHCVLHNIPLTVLKKWMGHADISTTAIYTNVIGKEERMLAVRIWV